VGRGAGLGVVLAAGCFFGWASGAAGQVEIPPGWEIRTIVEAVEGRYCGWPDINDRGDLVFDCQDWGDWSTSEIYLYSGGELIQVTHDNLKDGFPKINNNREIVWQRELDGDGDWDIVLLRDGKMRLISDEPYAEGGPDINDAGHIAWDADPADPEIDNQILYFDGRSTRQISNNALSNQGARINQSAQIIWTRYNFGGAPWYSDVMLYRDGETIQVTQGRKRINFAGINDLGQVVWVSPQGGLEKWDDGVTVTLLPDGNNAQINNRGFISVSRSNGQSLCMWLLRDDRWWQLTNGPEYAHNGSINNRGEVVWQHGSVPAGIALLTRSTGFTGDLDFDEDVDLRDFTVLQTCFGSPQPLGPECWEGDLDGDEDIDIEDFNVLVANLEGPRQ
jgi:hypothetical protein